MKRLTHVLGLVLIFLASFVFFLYITFPYEVLKENISSQVSQSSGFSLRIGSLSPKLPLGIEAGDVVISQQDGPGSMNFDKVRARISVLGFLTGKVVARLALQESGGSFEVSADVPIGSLIDGTGMPDEVTIDAKKFPIDDLAGFGIAMAAAGDQMAGPLIAKIGITGRLNGRVALELDTENPTQSKGVVTLKLDQSVLVLSDPSLGLDDQVFKKALVKGDIASGKLVVDKASGFESDELTVDLAGNINLKQRMQLSQIDMNVQVKMDKGLKEKFGFVIGMVLGDPTRDSEMTVQVSGPLGSPEVTTF